MIAAPGRNNLENWGRGGWGGICTFKTLVVYTFKNGGLLEKEESEHCHKYTPVSFYLLEFVDFTGSIQLNKSSSFNCFKAYGKSHYKGDFLISGVQ